ncbi:MAG: FG-GAP-like repeat-containing protein [Chitinophagaceae bacterium]
MRAFDIIDEDNDGDTDILLFLNNALFISLNETGVFTDTLLRSSITDGYYAGTPLVEDIDSDGRQDVISGSFQTYYHHNTALTGIDSIPAVMPFNYNYTIAADINDDGFAEIAGVPDEDYFPGDSAFAIEINPEPVYVVVEHSNDSLTLDENLVYT